MMGIRFIKVPPTTYLIQYVKGKVRREGAGLALFYYGPMTSLVAVPVETVDAPFIFNEVTSDFQAVSIQGQITYRIAEPQKTAQLLNFTLDAAGRNYVSEDREKIPQRLVNLVQVLMRTELRGLTLRDALKSSDTLVETVLNGLSSSGELEALGLVVMGMSVLAIKPTPETARALEAQVREQLLKESDEAIYARRTAAVELERAIKENELNTEIAVETKKRQIRETQMDAERAVQEKRRQIAQEDMAGKIQLEEKNKDLVALSVENARAEADAKAYAVAASMKALAGIDPKVVQALASVGMQPSQLIAQAFRELAENADKIGTLNVSPELLRELLDRSGKQ